MFVCFSERKTSNKFYLIKEKKTWLEAQSYCRKHHTDLVSGQNQLQDKELVSEIASIYTSMIFGLFRDTWKWSDGSSFSFRHRNHSFADHQPDNKSCAMVMLNKNSSWETDDCNSTKSFFCYDSEFFEYPQWKHIHSITLENISIGLFAYLVIYTCTFVWHQIYRH